MNVPLQNYGVEAVEHVSIASNEWSNQNINPEEQNQAPNVQVQKSSPMRRLHLDTTSNQPYVDVNHLAPGGVVPLNQGNLASTVSQNQIPIGLGLSPPTPGVSSDATGLTGPSIKGTSTFPVIELTQAAHATTPTSPSNLSVPAMTPNTASSDRTEHLCLSPSKYIQEPMKLLPDIGNSIDELAAAAADARVHFHGGRFDMCTDKMDTIKHLIRRVAEMGVTGLSLSSEMQQQCRNSGQPLSFSALGTPEQERVINSAAAFSTLIDDIESRKRRMKNEIQSALPIKSLCSEKTGMDMRARSRSELAEVPSSLSNANLSTTTAFSPSLQSGVFDFSMPAPSSFPTNQNLQPSAPSFGLQEAAPVTHDVNSLPTSSDPSGVLNNHVLQSNSPQAVLNSKRPSVNPDQLNFTSTPVNESSFQSAPDSSIVSISAAEALKVALNSGNGPSDSWNLDPANPLQPSAQMNPITETPDLSLDPNASAAKDGGQDDWSDWSGDRAATGLSELSPELRAKFEAVFHEFLTSLCSNLEAKDERGELIHQTLMPKKMARLDESPDFRPFKFRIQAFTMAFKTELRRRGISEESASMRRIKQFLWSHPFISRFNEDGKKAKSKGNHIWIIQARRLPAGGWEFFTFSPKIAGASSKVAYVNEPWTWNLRIWDPQASSMNIKVVYSANTMPSWLHWEDNEKVLTGVPTSTSQGGNLSVTALYVQNGQLHRLEHSFYLHVMNRPDETGSGEPLQSSDASLSDLPLEPKHLCTSPPPPTSTSVTIPPVSGDPKPAAVNVVPPELRHPPVQAQLSVSPSQPTPAGPNMLESQTYEVVEPSRAHDVLASIPYPFTPPVYMNKNVQAAQGFDPALIQQHYPDVSTQAQPSISDPLHQTAIFVDNTSASTAQTPSLHGTSPVSTLSPPAQTPATMSFSPNQSEHQDSRPSMQLWRLIDRRQREQASSFMLHMFHRPQSFTLSEHPGQGSPMTNMPNDINASLPSMNPSHNP